MKNHFFFQSFQKSIMTGFFALILALGLNSLSFAQTSVEISDFPAAAEGSEQRNSQWCWAASIQAVLAYYDIHRSQEEIVYATYGRVDNLPARTPNQLYNALNNIRFTDSSTEVVNASFSLKMDSETLLDELSNNHPIIIWANTSPTSGHAVVIYGASFFPNGNANQIRIFDPYPGRGFKTISAQAVAPYITCFFAVRGVKARN